MKKLKTLVFIALIIGIPVIKGEVDIPQTFTSSELLDFMIQLEKFWYTRIESMVPTILGLF